MGVGKKLLCFLGSAALIASGVAHAAYRVTIQQVGSDVVASGSGTINTAGLSGPIASSARTLIRGQDALLYIGGAAGVVGTSMSIFSIGGAGPTSFGTSATDLYADTASGDFVGIVGTSTRMFVPSGYISQSNLSSSATWNGATIASLGLTPGTYTWTWGAGATADSFILEIDPKPAAPTTPAGIPTLTEWALIGLSGLVALFGISRVRRRG
jgi:hypothetical protein